MNELWVGRVRRVVFTVIAVLGFAGASVWTGALPASAATGTVTVHGTLTDNNAAGVHFYGAVVSANIGGGASSSMTVGNSGAYSLTVSGEFASGAQDVHIYVDGALAHVQTGVGAGDDVAWDFAAALSYTDFTTTFAVVDASNSPIAGVPLWVKTYFGLTQGGTKSDASGQVTMTLHLSPGAKVMVGASDRTETWVPTRFFLLDTSPHIDILAGLASTFTGHIQDVWGNPDANDPMCVTFSYATGDQLCDFSTNAAGDFSRTLRFHAITTFQFAPTSLVGNAALVYPTPGTDYNLGTFVLPATGSVTAQGTLTDVGGNPLSGETISFSAQNTAGSGSTTTDASGHYSITLAFQSWGVQGPSTGTVTWAWAGLTVNLTGLLPGDTRTIDFVRPTVSSISISGAAVDEYGDPLPNTDLTATSPNATAHVTTDGGGEFSLNIQATSQKPVTVYVTAKPAWRASFVADYLGTHTVVVQPPVAKETWGKVTTQGGTPLPGALVCVREAISNAEMWNVACGFADANGNYDLSWIYDNGAHHWYVQVNLDWSIDKGAISEAAPSTHADMALGGQFEVVHVVGSVLPWHASSLEGQAAVLWDGIDAYAGQTTVASGNIDITFQAVFGREIWMTVPGEGQVYLGTVGSSVTTFTGPFQLTPFGCCFNDVDESHAFAYEIYWAVGNGITTGYADGGFHPAAAVSRQAMAAFLYRLAGSPAVVAPGTPPFGDVPFGNQFFNPILWMSDAGITTGFADGGFHPSAPVSRQAMAAFLYRFAGSPPVTALGTSPFSDVDAGSAFFTPIVWMAESGISTGYPDGTFRPADPVSRQAMAAFLYRLANGTSSAGLTTAGLQTEGGIDMRALATTAAASIGSKPLTLRPQP